MATEDRPLFGTIVWTDLTVPNADDVRDFCQAVVGWKPEPVGMGEYNDYNMVALSTGDPAGGVCHARGGNADLPAQWLIYILVPDLEASMEACTSRGGQVISGPKSSGSMGRFCVIKDPAGAVAALFCPTP